MSKTRNPLVLGLNSSTQGLSAIVIDPESGTIVWAGSIKFNDPRLVDFGVPYGYVATGTNVVVAPPLLWLHALDLLLLKILEDIGPEAMKHIARISGAGQQHGTVYLTQDGVVKLGDLDPARGPQRQFGNECFTRVLSPIWMDSSTEDECRLLAEKLGGALRVAELTGSIPIARFAGMQIWKWARQNPSAYKLTEHIALVSSFMCSMFIGKPAPIDYGDGAGMNLMNISTLDWDAEVLHVIDSSVGGTLSVRLPNLVPTLSIAGKISSYMVSRYGFSPEAQVLPFSGDNPHSLLGAGVHSLDAGNIVLSLGTSDTLFGMTEVTHDPNGAANIFGAVPGGRMALLCFKNGSHARESIRDLCFPGDKDWSAFDAALNSTPPANGGAFMLPYYKPEILPHTHGDPIVEHHGFEATDTTRLPRAICEAQFMNIASQMIPFFGQPSEIRVTGGASVNSTLLQIVADVLNAELVLVNADTVSLGAALAGAKTLGFELDALTGAFCAPKEQRIVPRNAGAYTALKERFEQEVRRATAV